MDIFNYNEVTRKPNLKKLRTRQKERYYPDLSANIEKLQGARIIRK